MGQYEIDKITVWFLLGFSNLRNEANSFLEGYSKKLRGDFFQILAASIPMASFHPVPITPTYTG